MPARKKKPTTVTEHVQARPTGSTAFLASAVVLIASWAGLDLTAEEAAVIIGAVTTLVSIFTPRPPAVD